MTNPGPATKGSTLQAPVESSAGAERVRLAESAEEELELEFYYDDEESEAPEPRPPADS